MQKERDGACLQDVFVFLINGDPAAGLPVGDRRKCASGLEANGPVAQRLARSLEEVQGDGIERACPAQCFRRKQDLRALIVEERSERRVPAVGADPGNDLSLLSDGAEVNPPRVVRRHPAEAVPGCQGRGEGKARELR